MTKLTRAARRFGSTAALAALLVGGSACGAIQGASGRTAAEPVAAHDAAAAGYNWISADSQYGVASAAGIATTPCDSTCLVP
jgi:hypothetical protein